MALNSTPCYLPPSSTIKARTFQYILYVISGLCSSIFNILIVLAVARFKALREQKDYILLSSLALADFLYGMGHLVGGSYRLVLLHLEAAYCMIPRWWCMLAPQSLLWHFSVIGASMLLVINVDRLVTVSTPLRYRGSSYAKRIVGTVYFLGTIFIVIQWSYPLYAEGKHVPAYCSTRSIVSQMLHTYQMNFSIVAALLSVFLFGLVIIVYKKHNTVMAELTQVNTQELIRIKRMTVTLGIASFFTFFFYALPMGVYLILTYGDHELGWFRQFSSFIGIFNINSTANFFIYGLRHKEMKKALKALFTCKSMPNDLRYWN